MSEAPAMPDHLDDYLNGLSDEEGQQLLDYLLKNSEAVDEIVHMIENIIGEEVDELDG
jgi:hypothetical protein